MGCVCILCQIRHRLESERLDDLPLEDTEPLPEASILTYDNLVEGAENMRNEPYPF
jgi:hypothetical protein